MKLSDEELKGAFVREHDARRAASSLIQAFENSKPPETLYHYTSVHGLKGIVERGEIWCTRIDFFNDASEIGYGLERVKEALKTIKTDFPGFADLVKNTYDAFRDVVRDSLNVYAACFCERGDLLSQWHGYGERGGGFCIGLSTSGFDWIIKDLFSVLRKIHYDPQYQIDLIRAEISAADEALCQVVLSHNIEQEQQVKLSAEALFEVVFALAQVIVCMKDPLFQTEVEWRLIHYRSKELPRDSIEHRASGQLLIPYIPTPIRSKDTNVLPVREVIIGPTVNRLAERSVRSFLRQHRMSEVKVTRSEIPLQNIT